MKPAVVTFLMPLALVLTTACGPDSQQQAKRDADVKMKYAAEAKKFSDPIRGLAELKRQLRSHVKVKDRFIVVQWGFVNGLSVLPIDTPWMINCDLTGMTVTFGTSVSGGTDDVSNDASVNLAYAGMNCANQAIPMAHEVRALLSRQ